jgi:hypothetical protein
MLNVLSSLVRLFSAVAHRFSKVSYPPITTTTTTTLGLYNYDSEEQI